MHNQIVSSIPIYQVDAFTTKPFRGNPAAVCLLETFLKEDLMKDIAAEMNLSETAFVVPLEEEYGKANLFAIRWFTPEVEVPLCGHATLASSLVLFREVGVPTESITFESKSGKLEAKFKEGEVTLDFPINPPEEVTPPEDILASLNIKSYINCSISEQAEMLLIHVEDEEVVKTLKPNFTKMLQGNKKGLNFQGVIVTAASKEFDFVSRYFGPWEGLNEDPVTGSAHTVLAPYWAQILKKNSFLAYQASKRGGKLKVKIKDESRVEITGEGKIVLKGRLFL
jgi:PhzF family phenazine biosynthesis protein